MRSLLFKALKQVLGLFNLSWVIIVGFFVYFIYKVIPALVRSLPYFLFMLVSYLFLTYSGLFEVLKLYLTSLIGG